MPTITIALPSYVTELQAEPFERVPGSSGEVAQTVSLTAGAGSIVVAATGADWCWRFTEHGPGYRRTRFCTVAGDAAYSALVDLDPGTLMPGVEPADPAWEAIANAAAANVIPTIAGGALGVCTHIGAKTKAAVLTTLAAAEALGRGVIVQFPAGSYDLGAGLSLAGYSCQVRGVGAAMLNASAPAGTVFYASAQAGPALDFKGWVAPAEFSGRVRHGDFVVRGSGVADPTKANVGLRVDFCQSTTFSDIAIMGTGGPGLKLTADTPGFATYLCDFERITVRTPVSAKVNDVPYVHTIDANGNRFRGFGFISRLGSADCGVSGALVIESSASYPSHDNLWDAPWFENLHIPTGGTLTSNQANANRLTGFQFFDIKKESGATGTFHFKLLATPTANTGGNSIEGVIPGDNGVTATDPDGGVYVAQSYNRIEGVKGWRGGNVTLAAGVNYTYAHLRGSISGASSPAFVDSSGTTTNVLVDDYAGTAQRGPSITSSMAGGGAGNGIRVTDPAATNTGALWLGDQGARVQAVTKGLYLTGDLIYLRNTALTNLYAMFLGGSSHPSIQTGSGTPEGSRGAAVGSLYLRIDGGAGTSLYVKESGTGNTGWVAK